MALQRDMITFQLVRINPSGGETLSLRISMKELNSTFQLVRINPSGGVFSVGNSIRRRVAFQLVRINPSGGELK